MENDLLAWLHAQQPVLDALLCQAASACYREQRDQVGFTNLDYDLGVTSQELWQLSNGQDLCYDRPTIGLTYSLWYHARRVNTFLRYFARELSQTTATQLDLFDLGAGTGAVQWAVGLVYAGLRACGQPVPQLTVINVDSSPFMLEHNRRYLWPRFVARYPACQEINCSFNVNSWNTPAEGSGASRAWVVSSYLFDHVENKEFLAEGFQALVRLYQPERVMLLTARKKESQQQRVATAIRAVGYQVVPGEHTTPLFAGELPRVTAFRRGLRQRRHVAVPPQPVTWDDPSFTAVALGRTQAALDFAASTAAAIREVKLYVSPLVVRRDIQLNAAQRRAAEHTTQPTIITGPAGCGKSVVVTERLRNLLVARDYDPSLRVLLTSFNVELVATLTRWLAGLLDPARARPVADGFHFANSPERNLTCLHFDVLPTRLGQVHRHEPPLRPTDWHLQRLAAIAREVRREHQLPAEGPHTRVLNPEFLFEEFHRVVYGLGYLTAADYLTQPRTGRGSKIAYRPLVWACFERYFAQLGQGQSFTNRRLQLLRGLRNGSIHCKFDYVFVDEYQDCTPADLEIFRHLLHDPDCIVLAGDLAQAVQIGRTSAAEKRFRHFMGLKQDQRTQRLQGSYRLPFRISEAIRAVSEQINTLYQGDGDAGVITPYKGSPPGARPVLVYGADTLELAARLAEVVRVYAPFQLAEVTILERDPALATALAPLVASRVVTDTVLRLKGLEKSCVVWSTSADIEHRGEVFEFVYTILTRTCCLLLITLSPATRELYVPILQALRPDRLICWDEAAREQLAALFTHEAVPLEAGELEE